MLYYFSSTIPELQHGIDPLDTICFKLRNKELKKIFVKPLANLLFQN